LDCPVICDSFSTGPTASQMRSDQIKDVWREVRRKPPDVEGTGLGLCLSRGLMEAMGGAISGESEAGSGSTIARCESS